MSLSRISLLLWFSGIGFALDNGLARTPPMGWLSWERFRCNTDCVNDPDNCISENLFKRMADLLVSEGYAKLGYNIVAMDDCWLASERDSDGRLQPDLDRFPSGIKALADYIHDLGLKFGIYEDFGNYTCGGYPGVEGHLETDANTFAKWTVDYVKLDGCYSDPADMDEGYTLFGYYLNQTGRPMVYSCSWPVYQMYSGIQPDWEAIVKTCNLWRNFDDIDDSWNSVDGIIEYYGLNQKTLIQNAGPGHWNDPDMVIIGNFGLSFEQSKSQMALWAIFASPLIMSVDLRTITERYKAILQNRGIIAINQDPLGIQGRKIYEENNIEIYTRPITPFFAEDYSYAVAFRSRRTDGMPYKISVTLEQLGLTSASGYSVTDLFEDMNFGTVQINQIFTIAINPTGVVLLQCNLESL